jgi:hypothetical protein
MSTMTLLQAPQDRIEAAGTELCCPACGDPRVQLSGCYGGHSRTKVMFTGLCGSRFALELRDYGGGVLAETVVSRPCERSCRNTEGELRMLINLGGCEPVEAEP